MRIAAAFFLLALSASIAAGEAKPAADDPALEARVMKLAAELRCLVCQNQSLADSHADLAIDLKNQVREQLRAGRSEADIRDYMVARYGDFVLYTPPLKSTTWLLWLGPFLALAGGAVAFAVYLKRRPARIVDAELSPEEKARVRALLDAGSESERR